MNDRLVDSAAVSQQLQADEARQERGKLKIFFGAAPGVGKTYTMLEAGREQAREGADVVVGYIEPHARPETQALVLGLDLLARKDVAYRGLQLAEFDLEAALRRRPQLILVDELAHSNAPGQTHAKRWQDVRQLLAAGVDVYTTLNVQHLESLRDVVAQITGVWVAETIPDAMFDTADEVELVDLPTDDLLERLREGKVYTGAQAERALENFFSKGNLIALRELALRKAAERVGAQMDDYRELHRVGGTWPASEHLLVCVGPSPLSARLVRATRRIAQSIKAPWIAVHLETPADTRLSEADRDRLAETLHLAEQLGGETVTLSGGRLADELLHYARSRNVTKIIVGKTRQPRWKEWLAGSLVYELTRKCGDIDVYVISGDADTRQRPATARVAEAPASRRAYLGSVLVVLACTLACWTLSHFLSNTNLIMIYLLGVVAIATRFGRGPSMLASVLSVAAFDFFFVPPAFTLAVADTEYVFTIAVMLATALVISTLTARVRFQAESARSRERRTASLYGISHQLAAVQTREQIAQAVASHVGNAVDAEAALLFSDGSSGMVKMGAATSGLPGPDELTVARWVLDHCEIAGHGTGTLPQSKGVYLPLRASHGTVGVLGVLPHEAWRSIGTERLHLLEAFAGLIALAIERVELAGEAARIRIEVETERLRSSLLSAVSHDLRTPLSVITGGASTLLDSGQELDPQMRQELLQSILDEADRLNRLVANLLDMTRLEAGALKVHKQWQAIEEIVGSALARLSRQLIDHLVVTHLQPDMPFVPIDDLLIEQVLVNLLENAAKYSPAGSTIELAAMVSGSQMILNVADRGRGLPPDELPRIFDKFFRSSNAAGRPGAGLGLAICRGIVELHGGTIKAQNRAGGGTEFRVSLPLAAPEVPVPPVPVEA